MNIEQTEAAAGAIVDIWALADSSLLITSIVADWGTRLISEAQMFTLKC